MSNGIGKIAVFSSVLAFVGLPYVGAEVIATGTAPVEIPLGQSAQGDASLLPEDVGEGKDDNLFGLEGGYFHPYITLNLEYTDNLYNIDEGKKKAC